ncbi:hypothetical protein [Campylobacter sp. RM16192]|uniref:hypothetical protein n=1 Tax=Campylobacter sp. RM16192 TaxID=1660080 RepID=UPI001452101C|nr:hypothetical protein [Campylobacter sp. RM16192]QCD52504.1 hypothetical protein CDOMC_0881 [Campylobacter sp. RM16192]
MRHKAMFLFLGTIVAMETNGLSLYKKGKEEGRVSGGNIGDVVVREIDGGPTSIMIITEEEWEAMPKDEKTAVEIEEASRSQENLKDELTKAKNKIAELEEELKKAKAKKSDKADNSAKDEKPAIGAKDEFLENNEKDKE